MIIRSVIQTRQSYVATDDGKKKKADGDKKGGTQKKDSYKKKKTGTMVFDKGADLRAKAWRPTFEDVADFGKERMRKDSLKKKKGFLPEAQKANPDRKPANKKKAE